MFDFVWFGLYYKYFNNFNKKKQSTSKTTFFSIEFAEYKDVEIIDKHANVR